MTPKQFHAIAGAFPQTDYATSYGKPAWKAFGKFFTRLREEDDSVVLGQVSFDEREMLCAAEPETFHFTDHYRNYPMVLARLKGLDPPTLRAFLERQWRHNAPKKWIKAWDEAAADAGANGTVAKKTARKTTGARAKRPLVKRTGPIVRSGTKR